MSVALEGATLAGIPMKNHIIRSATHERMADEDGEPLPSLTRLYEAFAAGGIGCIITGYMGVSKQGRTRKMVMVDEDRYIGPLAAMVEHVHALGTPIIAQIAHCGSQTSTDITGLPTFAPSRIGKAREMTAPQIEQTIDDFVMAILRVKRAGFDGVQLHVAHGMLLSAFLSPRRNRRRDEWGGSTANRSRIVQEIIKRARPLVGDYPILVKMNGSERSEKGLSTKEAVEIARLLEASGCDGIEVSCGLGSEGLYAVRGDVPWRMYVREHRTLSKLPRTVQGIIGRITERTMRSAEPRQLYNVEAASQIKASVSIPVIVVGGICSLEEMEGIISDGKADLVSMCRPLIMEPGLVNRFKGGKQTTARCISCNHCLIANQPLRCYHGRVPMEDRSRS